ncbi:C48 family peptidase [Mesorhizobium australicum]|uniref:Ulp1 family isopeptidase n=1 Tax=Mesorhizobium australicum TaxID=536018 RepID=UPI00333C1AC5
MNRHKFDLSNVTGWRQVQPPASQEQAAQAGQEGFEQRSGEARQAAAQIPAPGVPALPDPFHPHPSQGDLSLIEGAAPWEAQPMMQGSGQEHAAAPYAGGSGSMLGASVLQPGHSTARHHHAPDSSVGDLNPSAPFELRDHARSAVPAAVQPDPPIVVSDGRGCKRPLYSNDATVVEGLRSLYAGKAKEDTVKRHVNSLYGFGRWLFKNNKPGFAARLHEESLDEDLKEYESSGGSSTVAVALRRLRESAGGVPMVGRAVLNPDPADAVLIKEYKAALIKEYKGAPATGPNRQTIHDYGATLRRFSEYLVENNKPGIAARLHEESLDEDAKRYKDSSGDRRIIALAHLRKFLPSAALGREIALAARPEDAVGMEARAIGDAAAQHSGPQKALGRPEKLPGEANEDAAVLPSSFVPTGHHHQASDPAESFRPLIWRDGDQRAPDERIAAQDRSNRLPSEEVPLRPPEFAPPSLRAGNSASPELFPEGMSPAVEGFFGVFGDPTGRVLGALQLLGDEHIQRDYQLLEQELQGNNPELAARTRFVDPLVANYHLRLGSESDKLSAFQRIVHNQNGNDTADFLFVPVSDGGKTLAERGKHWSLLFVDRSDRERPVAYHYDSVSGWHDKLAKHLAERLGASLETRVDLPRIAQQSNEWDCGVYVVDGTRALVGRLQRWQPDQPDLNLNNLVVNRQALQTRLMGDDTSGTANYLTNFELMDRQARDAVKESPVGTFHQRIKRLGQSARALHDRALAPVAPDQGNPDSVFVRDVVPGETRHHHAPDSSVVDLNPPAPFELRDHARSMPAAVQPDPPVVVSGRDKRPLYSNDATVVEGLRSALYAGKVGERTVTDHVNSLLGFGRWLFDNNKPGFAARLDDPLLDQDLKEYQRESGSSNVARALGRLKESAGGAPMVGRAALNPDPVDAELIRDYKAALIKKYEAEPATGPNPKTTQDYAATLRRFSQYLHEKNRPGIAARLYEGSLDEDARRYLDSSGNRWISALAHLRKFPPYAALGREIALAARPEDAVGMEARAIGDAAAQHSGPQKALGRPEKLPGKAKQLSEISNSGARVLMQAPTHQVGALPWEAQPMMLGDEHLAPHTGGSGSMLGASVLQPGHSRARHHDAPDSSVVDLNPLAPSDLRDHARSVPAAPAGPAFARAEETPSAVGEAAVAERWARLQKQMDEPVHDPGPRVDTSPWEAQLMVQGSGQEHAAAPYAGGSGSMLGASVLQPGHSTARHHHAPDSSVVDLNPPAPFELRDHARSVPAAPAGPAFARAGETPSAVGEAAVAERWARLQKQKVDADLSGYFDSIPHADLLRSPWEAQLMTQGSGQEHAAAPYAGGSGSMLGASVLQPGHSTARDSSVVDLNPPAPFELRDHARSVPAAPAGPAFARAEETPSAVGEAAVAERWARLQKQMDEPVHDPGPQVDTSPWEAQLMVQGSGQEHAAAPYAGDSGSRLGASVLQPGHSTARHHDAPDSSVVDLNPPAPSELRDHARSVPPAVQPDPPIGVSGRDKGPLYSNDATIVEGLRSALESTVKRHVNSLLGFGRWLFDNNRPGFAARLHEESLDPDLKEYESKSGSSDVARAVGHLKTWAGGAPVLDRAAVLNNPDPADAALIRDYTAAPIKEYKAAPTGPNPATIQTYGSAPRRFSEYLVENKKPGIAARLHEGSLDEDAKRYNNSGGISALAHLRKSEHGRELPGKANEDDAVLPLSFVPTGPHHQASDPAGSFRPLIWRDGDQRAPDERIAAQDRSNQLSSEEVLINREHDTAELRPAKRQRPLNSRLQDVATEPQLSEIGNSGARVLMQAPTHQVGALPWEAQPMMQGSGQEHAAAPYAGGSGSMLGASVLQPGHSTARHHHAPDSSVVDLNPPAPSELRDHARSVPAAVQPDPPIGVSGRDKGPLYSNDATVVEGLRSAYAGKVKESTVKRHVNSLLGFGRWLFDNNRPGFAARLDESSLDQDRKEYESRGGPSEYESRGGPSIVARALGRLKTLAGGAPVVDRPVRNPYPADAALIRDYTAALIKEYKEAPATGPNRGTIQVYGSTLIRFSEYLHENKKPGIADRLHEGSLDEDAKRYVNSGGNRRISALAHLRKFAPGREIALAARPEDAVGMEARAIGDAAAQRSGTQEALGRPERPPGKAKDGRVLGALEWLGDEHIQRDYQLLEQELQGNNPDLAARTRFVDPLVANYHLRLGSESVMLSAFQRIVHQNGNDTADFLFVPVSDGGKTLAERGTHWSLLFVDRSDRERPVAYHYDSYNGCNDTLAKELAENLGASLETRVGVSRIAQQSNVVDCGVYVVDGTRALVGRLQSQPDNLNLNNLVVNRQALQTRLRGDNTFGTANNLTNFELMDRQARDAVKESPVGTFHQQIKRLGQSAPDVAPGDPFKFQSLESKGDAAAQRSGPQEEYSWPEYLPPGKANEDDAVLASSLVPTGPHHQASDPAGSFRPLSWRDGDQRAPDERIAAQDRSNQLPSEEVLINREHDTAELRPAKRQRTPNSRLQDVATEPQLSEIGNSGARVLMQAPTHQVGALPWEAQPMMQGSGQEHAAAPYAGGSGSMLGASVLQPGHSTARHHHAPDSSVVDLNPPAPSELRDHARSVPAAVQPDRPKVVSGPDKGPLYSNDATLVEGLRSALYAGKVGEITVKRHVDILFGFGHWLVENNKPGIADRLHDSSLDRDRKEYEIWGGGPSAVAGSLARLKTWAGGAQVVGRPALNPHPADAVLIREYTAALIKAYEAAPTGPKPRTVEVYGSALRRFSQCLVENKKPGIADRLHERSLDEDAKRYMKTADISALTHVRKFALGREIALAARPEDAVGMEARAIGDAAAQTAAQAHGHAGEQGPISRAQQVAPAPFERHLGKKREAQDGLTSTLDRSNLVNSGGVIINNEHYTALLRPAKRQRTDNPQSRAMGRQLSEATTTSISQASDQARADLMASFRSRERSDAGR